jgi:hypothetical protein
MRIAANATPMIMPYNSRCMFPLFPSLLVRVKVRKRCISTIEPWTTQSSTLRWNSTGANLSAATFTGVTWRNTICPDGTNSDANGNTCVGSLVAPTNTIMPTNTATPTRTATPTITANPTKTLTPSKTATATKSMTPTKVATMTKAATVTRSLTPTKPAPATKPPTRTRTPTKPVGSKGKPYTKCENTNVSSRAWGTIAHVNFKPYMNVQQRFSRKKIYIFAQISMI